MRNTHLIPSHYFEKHHHKGNYVTSKPHLKVNIDLYSILTNFVSFVCVLY